MVNATIPSGSNARLLTFAPHLKVSFSTTTTIISIPTPHTLACGPSVRSNGARAAMPTRATKTAKLLVKVRQDWC